MLEREGGLKTRKVESDVRWRRVVRIFPCSQKELLGDAGCEIRT